MMLRIGRSSPDDATPWLHRLSTTFQLLRVPAFRRKAWTTLTPPACRTPPSQSAGFLLGPSRANDRLPVLTPSFLFRHLLSGSLAFVFMVLT